MPPLLRKQTLFVRDILFCSFAAVGTLVAVVLASDAKFQAAISERTISNDRGPKEPKGQL